MGPALSVLTAPTQIDSHVQVVTPENIAFEYRVAGPFGRVMALLLDLTVLLLLYGAIAIGAMMLLGALGLPGVGQFFALVGVFLLYWFYGGFFEAVWNGQTPGKRMMGLRVLRTDGRPINALQAVLRNLLRLVDALPWAYIPQMIADEYPIIYPTYLVALVCMTLTRRRQRVGDLAVGTMVVVEENSSFGRVPAPDEPGLEDLIERLPADFVPSRTLARALSHYVGRRRYFGPARRLEIAQHVGRPLVDKLGLPPDTNHDLLLCALYVRAFHEWQARESLDLTEAPLVPIPDAPPGDNPVSSTPVGSR